MPTIYTVLRAQHRHTLHVPVAMLLAPPRRPFEKRKSLLAAERGMFAASRLGHVKATEPLAKRRKVIVVGAGLAGLCAAYELLGLGYDVTVYEARDRVGGRVHSIGDFISGKTVEGGAELIGSNHPLWMAYARHFDLSFTDVKEYGNSPIRLRGQTLTFERSSALVDEMEKQLKALTNLAETIVDPFEPWTNRDARQLDGMSLDDWLKKTKSKDPLCNLAVAEMLEADNGVPADEQSLLGVLAMVKGGGLDRYWTDTEVFRCKGGAQQIAEHFRRVLDWKQKRVFTETEVASITGRDGKVRVEVRGGHHRMETGDDLILAVPPSVWYKIEFKDEDLRKKLNPSPKMGTNVKYLMRFGERFWEHYASSPTLTEDGPVDLTWETTEDDSEADFAMVAFSGSNDAGTCVRWKPHIRRKKYTAAMKTPYPGISQHLRRARFMDWPNDPWTKASYYFPRVNEVNKWGPFWKAGYGGWLHFAGEHTCYAFMGYMEGALSSGFRLARRLGVRDGHLPA